MNASQNVFELVLQPLSLLVVFFIAAAAAFVWFWTLTYKESTPRREDWKKFLSSFAGTALALSVGFVSIMLQQHSQLQQRQADEARQVDNKVAEENGQMRARLLYSITQKKLELQLVEISESDREAMHNVCSTDAQVQTAAFKKLRDTMSGEDVVFLKDAYGKLFTSGSHERDTLHRLLAETGFASRVTQAMLSDFLSGEIGLTVAGTMIMPQLFEFANHEQLPTADKVKGFCLQEQILSSAVREVMRLQLLACAAYAIVGLPKAESISRSQKIVELVKNFVPSGTADEKKKGTEHFITSVEAAVAPATPDFKTCWEFAEVQLETMP